MSQTQQPDRALECINQYMPGIMWFGTVTLMGVMENWTRLSQLFLSS